MGSDLMIFGKNIRIFNCDDYTREFYEVLKNLLNLAYFHFLNFKNLGTPQPNCEIALTDNFEQKTLTKYVPQRDHMMKDFMEHKLGGGRVTSQKQFLENDRRVKNN